MKKLQLFLSISLLFVLGFQLNAQTVEEIIAKHETAMGGAQKWSGLKSLRSISKFSMQGMDIQTTMNMLAGKAIKVEVEVMGNKMITCFDGSSAWMQRPAMMGGTEKPEDLPQEQVGSLKSQIFPGSALMKARAEGNSIEVESKEKLDGADVYVLSAKDKAGKETTIYVSASTFYVLKTSSKLNVQGQEMEVEISYSNYKPVEGLMFPFTIEQPSPMGGGKMEVEVSQIDLNPTIDLAFFAKAK